ncbi:hypothetical protein Cgig2_007569 [Carnegiea gigantea]|uniref:Uncharacterized protein n=1 Tax=Carnegiea gigantea TaxID=171969 RepID=A0A9Q1GMQ8_9CARY|nr:hypothetical protein Cgig2_007569 [Carnegiea gigantea]
MNGRKKEKTRCESSHRHTLLGSHHRRGEARETARLESDGRSRVENRNWSIGVVTPWARKEHEQTSKPRREISGRRRTSERRSTRERTRSLFVKSHTTAEYRELKKALYELADKGQIDRFLKIGLRFLHKEREPAYSEMHVRALRAARRGILHENSNHYRRWEGSYKVTEQVRPGMYRLTAPDRTPIPRTWHSSNLRKYYH